MPPMSPMTGQQQSSPLPQGGQGPMNMSPAPQTMPAPPSMPSAAIAGVAGASQLSTAVSPPPVEQPKKVFSSADVAKWRAAGPNHLDDKTIAATLYDSDPKFKALVDAHPIDPNQSFFFKTVMYPKFALDSAYPDTSSPESKNPMTKKLSASIAPSTAPFSNEQYGSGNKNPLMNAIGFAGNAVSDIGQMVNPMNLPQNIAGVVRSAAGASELAGHAFIRGVDGLMGTHVEADLKKIVDDNPNDHSVFGDSLRGLINGDKSTQEVLDTLKTYGIDKNGIKIADPKDPNASTMMKGFFEHPLLPGLIIGGAMAGSPAAGPADATLSKTTGAVSDVANKVMRVDTEGIKAAKENNAAFEAAKAEPKTTLDLIKPNLNNSAIHSEEAKAGNVITDKNPSSPTYGRTIDVKPSPERLSIQKTLDRTPGILDENGHPVSTPDAMSATEVHKGNLMDQARAELTKQTVGKIKEFQTDRYQNQAIKEVRDTLTTVQEAPENAIHFADEKDAMIQQKVAKILENQYSEQLKASGGEKELAKLDLRQWVDKQLPDSAYQKDLAELPASSRALMLFRRALNKSIDESAKKIGGKYGEYMSEVSNLFKAQDAMKANLEKPATLEERFTIPKNKPLNESPPTAVKKAAGLVSKVAKPAAEGVGLGVFTHLLP